MNVIGTIQVYLILELNKLMLEVVVNLLLLHKEGYKYLVDKKIIIINNKIKLIKWHIKKRKVITVLKKLINVNLGKLGIK